MPRRSSQSNIHKELITVTGHGVNREFQDAAGIDRSEVMNPSGGTGVGFMEGGTS